MTKPMTMAKREEELRKPALCELLPVREYLDGVMVQADGSLVAGYELTGLNSFYHDDDMRNRSKHALEALIRSLPERSMRLQLRFEITEGMDGALRAYANRMAAIAMICGVLAIMCMALFAYVRLQPPVVVRVDQSGEATVVGGDVVREGVGPLSALKASAAAPDGPAPSDLEGRAVARKFLTAYLTYTPVNVERQYADALNMMTLNFRTFTMNKFREDDTIGKIKAESITSSVKIRSIEPVPGMPWTYQVFGAKEIHRVSSQRIEQTEKMVCRYQVRLVFSGRTQVHPTGLLVGEFWEQQMVGEKDVGLEQSSALLDR